ncbi:hypothetical protein BDN71DRAFT_1437463, partial [Pleurotus eryngii]
MSLVVLLVEPQSQSIWSTRKTTPLVVVSLVQKVTQMDFGFLGHDRHHQGRLRFIVRKADGMKGIKRSAPNLIPDHPPSGSLFTLTVNARTLLFIYLNVILGDVETSPFRTMPPVRSAPLSQRSAPTCGELYFCQCWDCESHETIIPGTVANLVRGRYLPYAQFSKHQTSLKLSGLAVYSQQASDPSPGLQEGRVEAKDHQPRHVKPAKKSQTSNEELEAYCSQLRSFQRRAAQIPEIALSVRPAFKTMA